MSKLIDEMGNKHNRLAVIDRADNDKNGKSCWLCRCICGGIIIVAGVYLRNGNTKSCGCLQQEVRAINGSSTKGRKDTIEQRKRKSIAHTSMVLSDEHKRAISSGLIGKKKTEKHKQSLRRACPDRIGKNNPMYGKRGNLSPHWKEIKKKRGRPDRSYIIYKEWKLSVFEKDNFTCQRCGDRKGGNLNAHHVYSWKSFPSLRYECWNGVTLCQKCHRYVHSKKNVQHDYIESIQNNI